jgi:hypothetical protein
MELDDGFGSEQSQVDIAQSDFTDLCMDVLLSSVIISKVMI